MLVGALAAVVGLAAVLFALYRDGEIETREVTKPDWDLLPTPADVARVEFPLSFPGYDPASVELHLDLLRRAYADLLAVCPPEVVNRARQRAADRAGVDIEDSEPPPTALTEDPDAEPQPVDAFAESPGAGAPGADQEALRLEAAMSHVERAHPGGESDLRRG
jgi:DivIVA domain-containing protein